MHMQGDKDDNDILSFHPCKKPVKQVMFLPLLYGQENKLKGVKLTQPSSRAVVSQHSPIHSFTQY